jgi:UDP-N-acetylmuramyl pentapeptide synthase/poly-gamma-glutamate capsule biosynthesis protein CapA/YwtB (metallophosphatase superfamily)
MNIPFSFSKSPFTGKYSRWWPTLGTPTDIADIMRGTWTSVPKNSIEAFRHRPDTIEPELQNFIFVPELFARPNGAIARAALLGCNDALAKRASGIVASQRPRNVDPGVPCLIVRNVSEAIKKLAEARRTQSTAKFIAVTGSVGKSTTKNMIEALTSSIAPSHKSIANYNDGMESIHFTLSNLSPDHRFSVVEFSEVGDLSEQAALYNPQIAVITNIMWEHINRMERQGYRGPDAITRLAYLAAGLCRNMKPGTHCVLHRDSEYFPVMEAEVRKSPGVTVVTYGTGDKNTVVIRSVRPDADGSNVEIEHDGKPCAYRVGIPGIHMALNSVAAVTAASLAGICLETALCRLKDFTHDSHRGVSFELKLKDGVAVIRDESISSSIPSIRSSLTQLANDRVLESGRRIAVLGQINGLGHTMPDAMAKLAVEIEKTTVDRLYTIGSDTRLLNESIKDRGRVAPHFQTLDQLETALRQDLRSGDHVVIKSSSRPSNISMRKFVKLIRQDQNTVFEAGTDDFASPTRIVIGGDTYFGEMYQEKRAKESDLNYLEKFGYDYSGKQLAPLLQRAEFVVLNLECALTELTVSVLRGRKDYILGANPQKTINALKNLKVGGVLLGNNHAMDYAAEGLETTLDCLTNAGIQVSGAGRGRTDAQSPILKEFDVEGIPFKLAILSGYEYNDFHEEIGFYAGSEKIGVNNINFDRLKEQISDLRSQGYYVVVSPHWGVNYCFRTHAQGRLARRLVDAGADLILGHGPHMLNEVGKIDGVLIAYSLGNFIFNSEGEYDWQGVQPYSLVAELEFKRRSKAISGALNLYPIVSCNQMTQFQPTFVDDQQFDQVKAMLSAMRYDRGSLANEASFDKNDGRNCISMKLF